MIRADFLLTVFLAAVLAVPPATAAFLNDAEAVPHLDSAGKEGYREFLTASRHRAFAIAPGGAWSWKGGEAATESASEGALQSCQQGTEQPCVLYAVNDKVVFDAKAWTRLWGPYQSRAEAARAHVGKARGDRFYNLAFRNAAGKAMKLSDLQGKAVLLHFWGSWCPPCRREMPDLQKLYQALGGSPEIQMVLLQTREDFATARQWAQQQRLNLPLYDSGVKEMASDTLTLADGKLIRDRFVAVAFPTTYVLDRHGIVVFSHVGPVTGWSQYLPLLRDAAANSGK